MQELCLGTVQFGMYYGINNAIKRKPTIDECFEMLDYAFFNGIKCVDTAEAYGNSEEILGEYFKKRKVRDVKVISKLTPNCIDISEGITERIVESKIKDSLRRLNIDSLNGYLLHTPEYIYRDDIKEALCKMKEIGYVENIGVSIYELNEGYEAVNSGIVDYIQLPYSFMDQRGIKENFISYAKQNGVTIFARSAFLQGLYLMEEDKIPDNLKIVLPTLKVIKKILDKYHVDMINAIMAFIKNEKDIDYFVFGVEKIEQLREDIDKYKLDVPKSCIEEIKNEINNVDKSIIIPSLWKR